MWAKFNWINEKYFRSFKVKLIKEIIKKIYYTLKYTERSSRIFCFDSFLKTYKKLSVSGLPKKSNPRKTLCLNIYEKKT